MNTSDLALRRYHSPFQRHLSFFDRDSDGFIHYGDSLRGNLSIGLDFPVAAVMAFGYHLVYGNSGSILLGPFRAIEVAKVNARRNMLEKIDMRDISEVGLSRKRLVDMAQPSTFLDRMHINGLWAFAASTRSSMVSKSDISKCQQGTLLWELAERRRENRDHVLPLWRGGPISVAGHSWFVHKLFDVQVYQVTEKSKDK